MRPKEILDSLEGIEYGFWSEFYHRPFYPEEYENKEFMFKTTSIAHPKELIIRGVGSCYDTSLYIWHHLTNSRFNARLIYLEVKQNSHAAVIFQDPYDHVWYWLENSWSAYYGMHTIFRGVDCCVDYIKERFSKFANGEITYLNSNVNVGEILDLDKITPSEYMRICGSSLVTL